MDDWSLIILCSKMQLVCKNIGEVVTRRGDPGNCAYIVLTGAVKVKNRLIDIYRTDRLLFIAICICFGYKLTYIDHIYIVQKTDPSNMLQTTAVLPTSCSTSGNTTAVVPASARILRWATLIGASALTHSDPYYDNTTAIGKSHSSKYYINYIYAVLWFIL